jgi:hypothetical protein
VATATGDTACSIAEANIDVWLRDDEIDDGTEPFTREIFWASPDIQVLDLNEAESNPLQDATLKFTTLVDVTARNRGGDDAEKVEVLLYWADPATNLTFPIDWNKSGIFTFPGSIDGAGVDVSDPNAVAMNASNSIVIDKIPAHGSVRVRFTWAPPPIGNNIRADNHFCLLARLEQLADPSHIDHGGWDVITERNNIALHNVHLTAVMRSMASMHFSAIGSRRTDGLIVMPKIVQGRVTLSLPVLALPWRDRETIELNRGRFAPFGASPERHLANAVRATISGAQIEVVTGIRGAERLEVSNGVAKILIEQGADLVIPDLRLAERARMPARIDVSGVAINSNQRWIHVAQQSGSARVGGVAFKLGKMGGR